MKPHSPRRPLTTPWRRTLLLGGLALAVGCGHTGRFVWVEDYASAKPAGAEYVIAPGDTLNLQVWNQPGLSGPLRVRADGKVSVTFLNDVSAAGQSPQALAVQLQGRLKEFIHNPVVTLGLERSRALSIPVLGEVTQPGVFSVEPGSGVLQALAAAGGLGMHGDDEAIYVLRREAPGEPLARIRFRLDALTRGEGRGPAFHLRSGDVVVVE